jgi:hypothetical protein
VTATAEFGQLGGHVLGFVRQGNDHALRRQ